MTKAERPAVARGGQLNLDLSLDTQATFDSFLPDGNETALQLVQAFVTGDDQRQLLLHGPTGAG